MKINKIYPVILKNIGKENGSGSFTRPRRFVQFALLNSL